MYLKMGNTHDSIDERTKTLSDELIGKKAEREVKNRQRAIAVTAVITLLATVLGGIILKMLGYV